MEPPTATLAGQVLTLGLRPARKASGTARQVPAGPTVVAAGSFGPQGAVNWSFHRLRADPDPGLPRPLLPDFRHVRRQPPVRGNRDGHHGDHRSRAHDRGPALRGDVRPRAGDPGRSSSPEGHARSPEDGIVDPRLRHGKEQPTRGFTLEISDYFKLTDR